MKIFLVPPNEIDSLWDDIAPLIDKAFNDIGNITADDIKEALENSLMFSWIITEGNTIESLFICELYEYPHKKSCFVSTWSTKSGHEFDKYYPVVINEIENFSKINGCEFIESRVRKGLAKKLTNHGWKDTHSWIIKSLL